VSANVIEYDPAAAKAQHNAHMTMMFYVPGGLLALGFILGFFMRRKNKAELFRTSALIACVGFALLVVFLGWLAVPDKMVVV
jgi:FtsH-binding integral membrane protein